MKSIIKVFLRSLGYELHNIRSREQIKEKSDKSKLRWLEAVNIQTVLDVGANDGEFALKISKVCPNARIYSFEPLEDCYQQLKANLEHLERFEAFNVALGEKKEKSKFFRNQFTPSSSFLKMDELHVQSFPQVGCDEAVDVDIETLDSFQTKLVLESPLLLKIDVQGYEEKVILGASEVIAKVDILIIEISLVELYKGQLLFDDMYSLLRRLGFVYQGEFGQIRSPIDGRILQIDAIFVNEATIHQLFKGSFATSTVEKNA